MTTEVMIGRIRRAQEGLARDMQPDGRPSANINASMARALWELLEVQRQTLPRLEEALAAARRGGAR